MKNLQMSQLIPHFMDLKNIILHKGLFYSIITLKKQNLISIQITTANTLFRQDDTCIVYNVWSQMQFSKGAKEIQDYHLP